MPAFIFFFFFLSRLSVAVKLKLGKSVELSRSIKGEEER